MDLVGKSTTDSASLGGRSRCVVRPLNANRLRSGACAGLPPQRVWIVVSITHQLIGWSSSWSGAGCAARSQSGSTWAPSPIFASQSSHIGRSHAGAMFSEVPPAILPRDNLQHDPTPPRHHPRIRPQPHRRRDLAARPGGRWQRLCWPRARD